MVDRIEKIKDGKVTNTARKYPRDGGHYFECFQPGQTMNPIWLNTLDEVAEFLREAPNRRVRMEPGSAMISRFIHIDGEPL